MTEEKGLVSEQIEENESRGRQAANFLLKLLPSKLNVTRRISYGVGIYTFGLAVLAGGVGDAAAMNNQEVAGASVAASTLIITAGLVIWGRAYSAGQEVNALSDSSSETANQSVGSLTASPD